MDALIIALGLLCTAVALVALEAFLTAFSKPEAFARRLEIDSEPRRYAKVYVAIVMAGVFITYTAAVYGLLFWFPALERLLPDGFFADSSARLGFSLLAGFGLTGLSSKIADATGELDRLRVARATLSSAKAIAAQLATGATPDEAWATFDASDNAHKADRTWLRGLLEDLRRAALSAPTSTTPLPTPSPDPLPTHPGIPMDQVRRGVETMKALDAALPPIVGDRSNEITQTPSDIEGLYVVEQGTLIREWQPFKDAFSAAGVSEQVVEAGARELDITAAVRSLPSVALEAGSRAVARYQGDSHGGRTHYLIQRSDGTEAPLAHGLVFAPTLSGALGAFFVAHVLPTIGLHWHGFYDHDYLIHPHKVSLLSWLTRSGFTEAHAAELATLDHRAAVVLQVAAGTMTVSAYGSGKTTALTLFKRVGRDRCIFHPQAA